MEEMEEKEKGKRERESAVVGVEVVAEAAAVVVVVVVVRSVRLVRRESLADWRILVIESPVLVIARRVLSPLSTVGS